MLRVDHHAATAEAAELSRLHGRKLPRTQRLAAQRIGALRRARRQIEREPGEEGRDEQREQGDRHVDPPEADAAGLGSRHLAFMPQAAEGEHHAEQQADRHHDRQVLQGGEADQGEHDRARILVVRRALEHRRHLVGQQDDQQHARDGEPRQQDFLQDVAIETPQVRPRELGYNTAPRSHPIASRETMPNSVKWGGTAGRG